MVEPSVVEAEEAVEIVKEASKEAFEAAEEVVAEVHHQTTQDLKSSGT